MRSILYSLVAITLILYLTNANSIEKCIDTQFNVTLFIGEIYIKLGNCYSLECKPDLTIQLNS